MKKFLPVLVQDDAGNLSIVLEPYGVVTPVPAPTPTPTPVPTPAPAPPKQWLGTNFHFLTDWMTDAPLDNALLQRRPWISGTVAVWQDARTVPQDAFGNVGILASDQVARGIIWTAQRKAGKYELKISDWSRAMSIAGIGVGITYDNVRQVIVLDVPATGNCGILMNHQTDGAACPKLLSLRPAGSTATGAWSPTFVAKMSKYGCLRFMDWQQTNYRRTPAQIASDLVDDARTSWALDYDAATWTARGASPPLRQLIELCNLAKVDGWFCVPAQADAAYIASFLSIIDANLAPGLTAYVEHSNEVWNSMFPQQKVLGATFQDAMYAHAARTAAIKTAAAGKTRIKVVLGAWSINTFWTQEMLKTCTPDLVAIAPYFGHSLGDDVAAFTDGRMKADVDAAIKAIQDQVVVVGAGKLVAYEGGLHAIPGTSICRDARLEAVYDDYLARWKAATGGGLFCHYAHVSPYGSGGSWGEKEWFDQPETSKSRSIGKILGR